MVELARYDLPLVQLLMAEFALQPCNYDARSGAMRYHFLVQYGRTCHTKWADSAIGVENLPQLAQVLRTHKPARVLLLVRLHAAKGFGAQWSSGGHRLRTIVPDPFRTLIVPCGAHEVRRES